MGGRAYAELLRDSRRQAGLTVARASMLASVSTATLKRWEAGVNSPSREAAIGLLGKYGVDASVLPLPADEPHSAQRVLRYYRRRAGLTLREAASAAGLSGPSLHRYETAERPLPERGLQALAGVLRLPPAEALALGRALQREQAAPTGFLALDAFWALESLLAGGSPQDALEVLRRLVVIGEQDTVRELWPRVFVPRFRNGACPRERVAGRTFAAMFASSPAGRPGMLELQRQVSDLPPGDLQLECMLNLARAETASGRPVEAGRWIEASAEFANRRDDAPALLLIGVFELAAGGALAPSARLAERTLVLGGRIEHALPRYVAQVAAADLFLRSGEPREASAVLAWCSASESAYGYGSPLARQVRSRLRLAARNGTACAQAVP